MSKHPISFALPAGLLAALIAIGHAAAQTPTGVFAGKTVNLIIGFGPGGGYDLWARILARHIGRHLPGNPTVTPQNMEGAGSYRAANFIYNVAPKDGTAFALIARDTPLGPLTGAPGAQFDATKLSWLGTPAIETNVCIAYNTAPVKTVPDLLERQLVVGDTGPGTGTRSYPKALNDILGMKFRIVGVYPSSADVFLAMERGEVQGICESLDSVKVRRPDWIATKTVSVLFQGGTKPNPELKDAPFVVDLARNDADRTAQSAAGSAQAATRCLHGDHEGPGIHRRNPAAQARARTRRRRRARNAGQESLRHAQADHRAHRQADQLARLSF